MIEVKEALTFSNKQVHHHCVTCTCHHKFESDIESELDYPDSTNLTEEEAEDIESDIEYDNSIENDDLDSNDDSNPYPTDEQEDDMDGTSQDNWFDDDVLGDQLSENLQWDSITICG